MPYRRRNHDYPTEQLVNRLASEFFWHDVNINLMKNLNFSIPAIHKVMCGPNMTNKIIRLNPRDSDRDIADISNLCKSDELMRVFVDVIESSNIMDNLLMLQDQQLANFDWLSKLFANIAGILKNAKELSKLGKTFVDIQKNFGNMSISSLAETFVDLLNQRKLSNIILHIQSLLEELRPVIPSGQILDDLQTVLTGVRSLKIVTGSIFGDIKYRIKDLFTNIDDITDFLVDELKFSRPVVEALMDSSLHISKVNLSSCIWLD